jgi:hypothetical protein
LHSTGKDVIDNEEFSITIRCWHDVQTGIIQLRLVRVDTGEEVPIKDGSFLLRTSKDANRSLVRCYIRHIASGREAYVQGGLKLRAFIKDCLLKSEESTATPPDTPGE